MGLDLGLRCNKPTRGILESARCPGQQTKPTRADPHGGYGNIWTFGELGTPRGTKWSQVVPSGPKGPQGAPRGPKGAQGSPRGPKGAQGAPRGPKGPQGAPKGPKGPPPVYFATLYGGEALFNWMWPCLPGTYNVMLTHCLKPLNIWKHDCITLSCVLSAQTLTSQQ